MPPARPRARRRQLSSTPGPSSPSSPTSSWTSSAASSTSSTLSSSSSSSSPVSASTSTLYTTSTVSSSSATPTPTSTRTRPALTHVISSALQSVVTRKPELNPSHLPIPPLANAPTVSLPLTLTRPATKPNPPKPTEHVSTKTPVQLQPPRPTEPVAISESSTSTSSSSSSTSSSSSSSSSSRSANNLLPPPTSHVAPSQPDPTPQAPPTVSTPSAEPPPLVETETGSFQEPTGQAVTPPSNTKHPATTIAVPVAVSALVVLAVLGALLLLRRRRRRRQPHHPYMQQVALPTTPVNDSFGTVTTRSTGLGGDRAMMPNPFADAESLDERSQSPANSLYHDHDADGAYGSPFSDSYAAAAHHAAVIEASRFAAPRLSSTPRSEAPRFVFNPSDSDASVVGDAGHSTPHLVVTSFAPSASPPPPLPQLHIPPDRVRNSLLIDVDLPSTSPR